MQTWIPAGAETMNKPVLIKAMLIWFAMAVTAIVNGLVREAVLIPELGEGVARPLSALILLSAVLVLAWVHHSWSRGVDFRQAWMIGLLWVTLTLLFETGLGLMQGMTAAEMLATYHPLAPTLWLYVVLGILVVPVIVRCLRR